MSTFAIYAFVVTGLYIAYMSGAIMMDLFSKKGQKKDSTEVFNNSDMGDDADEERSTVVDETDDGYTFHHPVEESTVISDDDSDQGEATNYVDDDGEGTAQEEQPVDINPDDEDLLEEESMESKAAYESLKAVQEQMDAVYPTYQEEYRSDEFGFVMVQPISSKTRILRKMVTL